MSAQVWLGGMIVGSVLVIGLGSRGDSADPPPAPRVSTEAPWLTPQAAAEIIGPDGTLGPLFQGVTLGGLAPSPEVRANIAAFARAHGVDIQLEIIDDELAAVRFDVTFGGCCGYEAADVLAKRLGRPRLSTCCGCNEFDWIDDWAIALEDGVHMRARVRVNRVLLRWERVATFDQVVARAEHLLGADRGDVSSGAGDRWREIAAGQYVLELPYAFGAGVFGEHVRVQDRDELGLSVVVDRRRIVEVSFLIGRMEGEDVPAYLRARWGRPRVDADDHTWIWHTPDRIVTAAFDADDATRRVTLRLRTETLAARQN